MSPRHLELVLEHPELAELDAEGRRHALRALLVQAGVPDAVDAAAELADFIDAYGPLSRLMRDDDVTDILVNGANEVWVERAGAVQRTAVSFPDGAELEALVRILMGRAGRRVDLARPIADARLADGSRMHVVLPPVAPRGPLLSIRRFSRRPMTLDDLVAAGMTGPAVADVLAQHVSARSNLVIAGATGSGKTTLMNALLSAVPRAERIVTIEETPELRLVDAHAVSLVARQANVEGAGAITQTDLLRAALRMRPDRLVVGEVRGAEALVALSALATGHDGSMVTVHARSASDVARRLVSLALQAPDAPSERSLREEVLSAFDVVVFLHRALARRVVASIERLA
ncbi:MAG TPA: ATPase, T2SS/T4P/T4SS family [Actinomycetota bacterium]|jgi:pilus assembly protein CpaF